MFVLEFLGSDDCRQLILTLAVSLLLGVLLAAMLWLCLKFVPAERPELRYKLSLATLVVLVLGTVCLHDVWHWDSSAAGDRGAAMQVRTQTPPAAAPDTPAVTVLPPTATGDEPGGGTAAVSSPAKPPTLHWYSWTTMLWLLGGLLMLVHSFRQLLQERRLKALAKPVEDLWLLALTDKLKQCLGMRQKVQLFCGEHIPTPSAAGLLQPIILLPTSVLTGIPGDQLGTQRLSPHGPRHGRGKNYPGHVNRTRPPLSIQSCFGFTYTDCPYP